MFVICPADAMFTSNSHPDTKSCSATKTENEPPTTCPMTPQRTSLAVHSHIRAWNQAQLSHGAAADTRVWRACRDRDECRGDSWCGAQCAAHAAGDLRGAVSAAPIWYRNFQYPQSGRGGAHLHLDVPSVSHLGHAETQKRVASDRPERTHVGVGHPVE